MRHPVLILSALAALGTNFGAHARAITDNNKNGALIHRDPAVIPVAPIVPKPKPIIPPPKPAAPIEPPKPVEPAPPPESEPNPVTPPNKGDAEPPTGLLKDPDALATLKNWKCGREKRGEDLFKRGGPFKDEDTANPRKYLEWLETMAKDEEGNRIPREKIVFYTKGTFSMADAFVKDNPGYTHYKIIFEDGGSTFMEDWNQPQNFEEGYVEAQSSALAEYSRNPIVFGADKSM